MVAIHIDLKSYCRQLLALAVTGLAVSLFAQAGNWVIQKSAEDACLREYKEKQEFARMLYSDRAKKQIADVSMRFRCEWEVALREDSHKLHFKVTDSEFDEFCSRLKDLNITCVTVCCLDMPTAAPCCLGMDSVVTSFPPRKYVFDCGDMVDRFRPRTDSRDRN